MNVDIDTVQEYAINALERPSDAAFWDDRCYVTHVPVIGWADRGDDILEESNFKVALSLLEGAAEDEEHVFQGSAGHWLVGNLEQVWVQVYEEDGETFTAAFIEAVEIQEALKDYPILDESDYSEREWAAFEENCKRALEWAQREYVDDTIEEITEIENAIFAESALSDLFGYEANAEVSEERVEEIYREYRDAYFLERATEVYRWNVLGYNPDQLELDIPA
jgi:hypothetical protein